MSAPLPPYFWDNVSESRRRRLKRRTRRRAIQMGFFGGVAGSLIALGVLHNNVFQLFWGFVLLLVCGAVVVTRKR